MTVNMTRWQRKDLTLESAPGADTNTHAVLADGAHDGVDDLPDESRAALFVSAPSVRAFVGHCLKELIWEITVSTVYLHPIKSGTVHSAASRFCVRGDVVLNLGLGQRTRWLRPAGQRDRRCGDVR